MDKSRDDLLEDLVEAEDINEVMLVEQKFAVLDQHPQ